MEDIEREVVEHSSILNGPDGIVSRVGRLEEWQASYLQGARAESCYGCAALDRFKADLEKRDKDDAEMMKGKMSLRGVYFMGIVQFLGIAATLIIGLLKK